MGRNLEHLKSLSWTILIAPLVLGVTGCGMETGAAPFTVNSHRLDPYKNFKFRVKWDGQYIHGVSKISPLKRTTEVVTHRDGGSPNVPLNSPGMTKFEPITLERGVTHDPAFEQWSNRVWSVGSKMSLKNFRKDIIVELHNEAGSIALAYRGYRCWPMDYIPLGGLNSTGESAVAIESLTLQCEGWERDTAVVEPEEN